jgi:hypothetical protein
LCGQSTPSVLTKHLSFVYHPRSRTQRELRVVHVHIAFGLDRPSVCPFAD